ncbi:MAG: hypothetical protein ACHQ1E_05820 [Ktedonobacterales bacterium]|jgi:hypothetical protein
MQTYPSNATRPSSVATRYGAIAGVALGILSLPDIALSAIGRTAGGALGVLFVLVALVVCAVAGFAASRHNGLFRSGVWAGFLAALITTFIALCLGTVIVILLAPYTLQLAHAAHPAAHLAARTELSRVVIGRAILGGLETLLAGLVGGLIGGALGRLAHPRGHAGPGGMGAPSAANPAAPTRAYATPMAPPPSAQGYETTPSAGYAMGNPPMPPANTPPLYYPAAPAAPSLDPDTPTTQMDSQG